MGITFMLPSGGMLQESDYDNRVSDVLRNERKKHAKYLRVLLASETALRVQCDIAFQKFDINGNGVLEASEAQSLAQSLCAKFNLPPPDEGTISSTFDAADLSSDKVLHTDEFPKFFKA